MRRAPSYQQAIWILADAMVVELRRVFDSAAYVTMMTVLGTRDEQNAWAAARGHTWSPSGVFVPCERDARLVVSKATTSKGEEWWCRLEGQPPEKSLAVSEVSASDAETQARALLVAHGWHPSMSNEVAQLLVDNYERGRLDDLHLHEHAVCGATHRCSRCGRCVTFRTPAVAGVYLGVGTLEVAVDDTRDRVLPESPVSDTSITLPNLNFPAAERALVIAALERGGSIVEAAHLLCITRHALKRRIIKHRIEWPRENTTHHSFDLFGA